MGPVHVGGGQLLVDHELFDGAGAEAPWHRPMRREQPDLDQSPTTLVRVRGGGHLGHRGADPLPDALGFLGEIERQSTPTARQRGPGGLGPQRAARARRAGAGSGPAAAADGRRAPR